MRRFNLSILCVTALTAACANADEFSWELVGSARSSDVAVSADADGTTLTATYHFQPIDDAAGPYELAAFLSRSSRIGASYNEDKTTALVPVITIGPFPTVPRPPVIVVDRGAGRSLSGRHVWRATGWYAGAAFAESDAAHPAPLTTSFSVLGDEVSSAALTLGKYVGRSTAVELSLEEAETTLTSSLPLFCVPGLCSITPLARLTSTLETDSESIAISAQHVGGLGELEYALSGGVRANESDASQEVVLLTRIGPLPPFTRPQPPISGLPPGGVAIAAGPTSSLARRERYSLAGELFPTDALGVRLGYARWDGDESLDESYELAATWFFKRRIGARVMLARTKTDLPVQTVQDVDTVTLQLIGRL
jgi:hypothetical protein